jgi:LmbE family N-acetylglucosaminyl deacetylase
MSTLSLPQIDRPTDIAALSWPQPMRLLALAPHPDDFDSVGVTMRFFHRRGHTIDVVVVSGSASGVSDDFCPLSEKVAVREQEQRDSLRFFGLPEERLTFLRLPEDRDGNPIEDADAIHRLLLATGPDLVLLPHHSDTNVGHRRTYAMFRACSRVPALLFRDPKTLDFRTDLFLPFDEETARWKRQLLLHHRSQHDRNLKQRGRGFDDRILDVNRQVALELACGAPYAEAFQVETFNPYEATER